VDTIGLVNIFLEAFRRLPRVAVHLAVPPPNVPLKRIMKDFAFIIHVLNGDIERVVAGPSDDDDSCNGGIDSGDDGGHDGSGSDSDDGLLWR
jgi:hypothetical protein